jgi:hypothetical protein
MHDADRNDSAPAGAIDAAPPGNNDAAPAGNTENEERPGA